MFVVNVIVLVVLMMLLIKIVVLFLILLIMFIIFDMFGWGWRLLIIVIGVFRWFVIFFVWVILLWLGDMIMIFLRFFVLK